MVVGSMRSLSKRKSSPLVAASTAGSRKIDKGAFIVDKTLAASLSAFWRKSLSKNTQFLLRLAVEEIARNSSSSFIHSFKVLPLAGEVSRKRLVIVVIFCIRLRSRSFSVSIKYSSRPVNNFCAASCQKFEPSLSSFLSG